MIRFDDKGRMRCDSCGGTLVFPMPISVITLAIIVEAFTADHEQCEGVQPEARSLVELLIEHGARGFEAGEFWESVEEFEDYLRAVAEVAKPR